MAKSAIAVLAEIQASMRERIKLGAMLSDMVAKRDMELGDDLKMKLAKALDDDAELALAADALDAAIEWVVMRMRAKPQPDRP